MKKVKFRPLRTVNGRVIVASYGQWRKLFSIDHSRFSLIVDYKYKDMIDSSYVFNHKGEQLFFFEYKPQDIPVFRHGDVGFDLQKIRERNHRYGIDWGSGNKVNYNAKGMDCDGVPTFSRFTANYVAEHNYDIREFEPLTVKMVSDWFGWILWRLENASLDKNQ